MGERATGWVDEVFMDSMLRILHLAFLNNTVKAEPGAIP